MLKVHCPNNQKTPIIIELGNLSFSTELKLKKKKKIYKIFRCLNYTFLDCRQLDKQVILSWYWSCVAVIKFLFIALPKYQLFNFLPKNFLLQVPKCFGLVQIFCARPIIDLHIVPVPNLLCKTKSDLHSVNSILMPAQIFLNQH